VTASPDTGELPAISPEPEHESPLIPSPTEPPAWYVSLVPPKDSLPLDFDPMAGSPAVEAAADVVPVGARQVGARQVTAEPAEAVAVDADAVAVETWPSTTQPRDVSAETRLSRSARLRALWLQGLPTGLTVLLVAALMTPGVMLDLARDGSFGLPSTVLFLLAAVGTPLLLRPRSLASAVVLPPLVFAGTVAAIAWRSGLNEGARQIGLDVGTTMALNAPLVFGGTAAALVVVAVRLTVRLVRR
jgi:hypothetical protein